MTSWITSLVFLAFAGLAYGQGKPIVVGSVVSQTGLHADLADGYAKGIRLWEAEVNAAGGLLGRPVELRMLDDGSDALRAATLYRQLIREARADLLVGPYGSAATRAASAEAERERRVMVNGAGPARVVQQGARLVFQTVSPYALRGQGILQVARKAGVTRLFILARQELAAQEIAEATRVAAEKLGFSVPEVETFSPYAADFGALIARANVAQAQAWIAFGEPRDAAEIVKAFRKQGYAPQIFFARRAADPSFIAAVGQDAELTLTDMEYDPRFARPANAEFVRGYTARWGTPPNLAAAEGYTAAKVLGEAVRRAGALDTEKLRVALAGLRVETPLGAYRVGANGEQTGIVPAVGQIQRGKVQVVWPEDLLTALPAQPYQPWNDRKVIE